MRALAEYRGFEYLLNVLPQLIPPLAEASAPHPSDVPSAFATLHNYQYVTLLLALPFPFITEKVT